MRDYDNPESAELRAEVFDMVSSGVFKEYRDARFMKRFHDDPAQLKTHEPDIANKLAAEEKKGAGNLSARIRALPFQVGRALDRTPDAVDETAVEALDRAARMIEEQVAEAPVFRIRLQALTKALSNATLKEIKDVQEDEFAALTEALEDLRDRLHKHAPWGKNL